MPFQNNSFPLEELAVAERFRVARVANRFSQEELADAVGATRSTIANFEYGRARVSFAIGFEFCRRLDLNPRWLATGLEPRRPFVAPEEIGVESSELKARMKRGVGFLETYDGLLRPRYDRWAKSTPLTDVVKLMMQGGPESVARRLSNAELEDNVLQAVTAVLQAKGPEQHARVKVAQIMLGELRERLEAAYPMLRK